MKNKFLTLAAIALFSSPSQFALANTFYVSPLGDDSADGLSQAKPWKTCEKVNKTKFASGDAILLQRGGEWHDHLQPSSDGAAGAPIVFDAYGNGSKPKIWGSDILDNAKFTAAGDHQYSYAIPTQTDSALVDHVFIPSSWKSGTLTITTPTDPRTDGKIYTACLRGNVIFSNRKNHLVFRNLVVDETAAQLNDGINQGYGVRIEGSTDVLVESCEAYRVGRHHFAAINTTGFVGRHLRAAYVVPKMPGDNTAYVSYADTGAPVAKCTSEWDDIAADHMEDGKGGTNLMFVSHGDYQGSITITRVVANNKMSFMTAPVVIRHSTVKENGSFENFGAGALFDGITLLDSACIDQWGKDGVIQNCVANLTPSGAGPTGYSAAILLRDKANNNVVRFNTLLTGKFSCLEMTGNNSATRFYGNIMIAEGNTIAKASGTLETSDVAAADYNFYAASATFTGKSLAEWQAQGFDQNSRSGDPQFVAAVTGKFNLKTSSPCLHAANVTATDIPPKDVADKPRSTTTPSMGAYDD